MHPEINAAALTPFDRQLLRALPVSLMFSSLFLLSVQSAWPSPRTMLLFSGACVGSCTGERSDTSASGKMLLTSVHAQHHEPLVRAEAGAWVSVSLGSIWQGWLLL